MLLLWKVLIDFVFMQYMGTGVITLLIPMVNIIIIIIIIITALCSVSQSSPPNCFEDNRLSHWREEGGVAASKQSYGRRVALQSISNSSRRMYSTTVQLLICWNSVLCSVCLPSLPSVSSVNRSLMNMFPLWLPPSTQLERRHALTY